MNYPSNMLYSLMLRSAGEMFGDDTLIAKAEKIAETVRQRSFDGEFFVDNEVRRDGVLTLTGERTEVCQYYAFFCGVATPESHPGLWNTLITDFGPGRAENGLKTDKPIKREHPRQTSLFSRGCSVPSCSQRWHGTLFNYIKFCVKCGFCGKDHKAVMTGSGSRHKIGDQYAHLD